MVWWKKNFFKDIFIMEWMYVSALLATTYIGAVALAYPESRESS